MNHGYPEVASVARVKPYSEEIRESLLDYRELNNLTNGKLARQLDSNETAVSKYLSGKPEGDVARFEANAADLLKNAATAKREKIELFDTPVSRIIAATIDTARKTNDFCVITGNAGLGKSCGLKLYVRSHPTSILVTADRLRRTARETFAAIWAALDTRLYKALVRKSEFLIARLKDSNRPLIIDNAHRLHSGAIELLFDLHDETEIPVCLVGNPEVLNHIRRNDQLFSRIGQHKHIADYADPAAKTSATKEGKKLADALIAQIAPGFTDCADLAAVVVQNKGHARALRKQLSLAEDVASKEDFRRSFPEETARHAFKAAHSRLIRDYTL